jgi:hypothetical protein
MNTSFCHYTAATLLVLYSAACGGIAAAPSTKTQDAGLPDAPQAPGDPALFPVAPPESPPCSVTLDGALIALDPLFQARAKGAGTKANADTVPKPPGAMSQERRTPVSCVFGQRESGTAYAIFETSLDHIEGPGTYAVWASLTPLARVTDTGGVPLAFVTKSTPCMLTIDKWTPSKEAGMQVHVSCLSMTDGITIHAIEAEMVLPRRASCVMDIESKDGTVVHTEGAGLFYGDFRFWCKTNASDGTYYDFTPDFMAPNTEITAAMTTTGQEYRGTCMGQFDVLSRPFIGRSSCTLSHNEESLRVLADFATPNQLTPR